MGLLAELRRRNVIRAGVAYAAVSWLIIQVVETLFPVFGLDISAIRVVVIVLVIGFLPAMLFAWAFEWTPEGFRRDEQVEAVTPDKVKMAQRLDRAIIIVLALAVTLLVADRFFITPQPANDRSIVVLPFADLSPAGDQAYFGGGIAEEILNFLAKYGEIRVISRTTAEKVAAAGLSTSEIAEELGVAYVLEGSVRKAGDTVRITAQLIEAGADTHLWSDNFDGELEDVLDVQGQIAAQVAQELKVRLLGPGRTPVGTDPETYELYLRGRQILATRGPDAGGRAAQLLEQVTERDPAFAPGHAALAHALYWQGNPNLGDRTEAAASRALSLDPGNSDALAILGRVKNISNGRAEGRDLLERAIESNANNALALRWLGQSYAFSDPARYVALTQRAYETDPLDPTIHMFQATALGLMGRMDEALEVLQRRKDYYPEDENVYALAGGVYMRAGQLDRAVKSYYLAYRKHPDRNNYMWLLHMLGWFGELELAEAWMHEIVRRFDYDGHEIAITKFLLGDLEGALEQQAARVARGDGTNLGLAFVVLRTTHDLERTRELLERGFEEAGWDPQAFNPEWLWVFYIDYALVLQHAGETEAAADLIGQMEALFKRQIGQGVKVNGFLDRMQFLYAKVLATRGDTAAAVAALRQGIRDGERCIQCYETFPHFDSIREDPGYHEVVAELESVLVEQRQRLADEGLLLTPTEVMALADFDFDPFESGTSQ
jgi:TolB-like protein/tetratricopeptide (TPR) repeat protein